MGVVIQIAPRFYPNHAPLGGSIQRGSNPRPPKTSPTARLKKEIQMEIEIQTEAEDFVKASEVQAVLGNLIRHYESRQQLLLAVMQEPEVKAAIQVMLARHAAKKNSIN